PAERFATARELADDLRRFLENKPIRAKSPSLANRVGKWARRHPELVAASVVLLFVVALGLAVSTFLLGQANIKANEETAKAVKEKAKAEAINHFFVDDLLGQVRAENVNGDRKVTLEELLERADRKIDGAFPDQPEVEAYIRLTLGKVYYNLTLRAKSEPQL